MAKRTHRKRHAKRNAAGRKSAARARPMAFRNSDPQYQPVDMKDSEVEAALKSGEHSGLLEDYFGPAQYAELKRLSQDAAQRRIRGGERVLILPGIMGSKLGYPRAMWLDDVIWADPIDIAAGRLGELKLNGGS